MVETAKEKEERKAEESNPLGDVVVASKESHPALFNGVHSVDLTARPSVDTGSRLHPVELSKRDEKASELTLSKEPPPSSSTKK